MTQTIRFRVLETFECPELRSTYVEGLLYTVVPENKILRVLVHDWLEEGRVEIVDMVARVSGSGTVT